MKKIFSYCSRPLGLIQSCKPGVNRPSVCRIQSKQTRLSTFELLRIAHLPFCLVSSSACGGDAGFPAHRAVPVFSNFPSLSDLGSGLSAAARAQAYMHTHTHIPVCRGSDAWQPASHSSDLSWQEFNSTIAGAGGGGAEPPCAVNTWLIWWRGHECTAPSLLALYQSLKSGSFPAAMWDREQALCLHSTDGALKRKLQPTVCSRVSVGCNWWGREGEESHKNIFVSVIFTCICQWVCSIHIKLPPLSKQGH